MTDSTAQSYLSKAEESLVGAANEEMNGRYNNSASRTYYACLQAAISALVRSGIRPAPGGREQWGHTFVHGQFSGELIRRRKRYPSALRTVLADLQEIRDIADYEAQPVSRIKAQRVLRQAQTFVEALESEGGGG